MADPVYDVAVIGAGVCGTAIARHLSRYHLRLALLEQHVDVAFGVSKANSGIIHAGIHHPADSLKARLELEGNRLYDQLQRELHFPLRWSGMVVAAFSYEEMKSVEGLFARGQENGVTDLEICGAHRLRELEPRLNPDVVGGLFAPRTGIMEPYRFVFALKESALKNGLALLTGFQVTSARREGKNFVLQAGDGRSLRAQRVVNAAGLHADQVSRLLGAEEFSIRPRKGEEFLLDRNARGLPTRIIFPVPGKHSKGTLVIPTVEGTMMIGPTAHICEDKHDHATTRANLEQVFQAASRLVPEISDKDIITSFAGLRPTLEGEDFMIRRSAAAPGVIQVAGIQSPGLTAAPAIAGYVAGLLAEDGLRLRLRKGFRPSLPAVPVARAKSPAALQRLWERAPGFGRIVCRCESVSEAEIISAIHNGHHTLDGLKFATRAGMGRCQGGFCTYRLLKLLQQEAHLEATAVSKRGPGSGLIAGKLDAHNPLDNRMHEPPANGGQGEAG